MYLTYDDKLGKVSGHSCSRAPSSFSHLIVHLISILREVSYL